MHVPVDCHTDPLGMCVHVVLVEQSPVTVAVCVCVYSTYTALQFLSLLQNNMIQDMVVLYAAERKIITVLRLGVPVCGHPTIVHGTVTCRAVGLSHTPQPHCQQTHTPQSGYGLWLAHCSSSSSAAKLSCCVL